MTSLDTRLHEATAELRADVARIAPPPFEPERRLAPMLVAAVLAIAIGLFGVFAMLNAEDRATELIVTEPSDVRDIELDDDVLNVDPIEESDATEESDAAEESTAIEAPSPREPQLVGPVTTLADGAMAMPITFGTAWNADESLMLLYRREASGTGHVVIDATTGLDVAVPDIDPSDIEQVYWSPIEPSILYYVEHGTADLYAFDVNAEENTLVHTFEGCGADSDENFALSVPSLQGDFGFRCIVDDGTDEMVTFNVLTNEEVRRPFAPTEKPEPPFPSPSGDYFIAFNALGAAYVLDAELVNTEVTLEIDYTDYVFVEDSEGREAIAAGLYEGDAIGTVVVLPLTGEEATVIIGPDAGDEYPPSGTMISAVGSNQLVVAIDAVDDPDADSALAGHLFAVDLRTPTASIVDLGTHGATDQFGYWSAPHVSLSPSGRFLAVSSDNATDAVNTTVVDLPR